MDDGCNAMCACGITVALDYTWFWKENKDTPLQISEDKKLHLAVYVLPCVWMNIIDHCLCVPMYSLERPLPCWIILSAGQKGHVSGEFPPVKLLLVTPLHSLLLHQPKNIKKPHLVLSNPCTRTPKKSSIVFGFCIDIPSILGRHGHGNPHLLIGTWDEERVPRLAVFLQQLLAQPGGSQPGCQVGLLVKSSWKLGNWHELTIGIDHQDIQDSWSWGWKASRMGIDHEKLGIDHEDALTGG